MGPLFLTVALAAAKATGWIWIRVDPGHSVLVDGSPSCVSSVEESGCIVENVAPGKHEVRVLNKEGRSAVFDVDVVSGDMATVKVPTLAFRANLGPPPSTIEVHTISDVQPCGVTIDTRTQMASPDVVFDNVSPGDHNLTVLCASPPLEASLKVMEGHTLRLEADVAKRKVRIVDERARARPVHVRTAPDALTNSDLPPHWKRALVSSMPAGVRAEAVTREGPYLISATFSATNVAAVATLYGKLQQMSVVAGVGMAGFREYEDGTVRFRLQVSFAE